METLDLYKIAENEKITFFYDTIKDANGAYFNNCILLNKKIINTDLEKEVLAEELGHHFMGVLPTPPFSTDYYNKLVRSRNEYQAKKWSIRKLIPFNNLKRYLKLNMNKFEIAEEIGISASLIEDAFNIYNNDLKEVINKLN